MMWLHTQALVVGCSVLSLGATLWSSPFSSLLFSSAMAASVHQSTHPIPSHPALSHPIPSTLTLSHPIPSTLTLSRPILFHPLSPYPILFRPLSPYPILSYSWTAPLQRCVVNRRHKSLNHNIQVQVITSSHHIMSYHLASSSPTFLTLCPLNFLADHEVEPAHTSIQFTTQSN